MLRHPQTLMILNRLRDNEGHPTNIAQLVGSGQIPTHTGGGMFGDGICRLLDAGFIELFDSDGQDLSAEVGDIGDKDDWTLSRGYKVADFLRGREKEVTASLTPRLGEVQSVLGVSISRLLQEFGDHRSMVVRPRFGKPSGSLSTDVFVLMPFRDELAPVYNDHIQPVCKRLSLECKRADDIFGSSQIIDDVWELIVNSETIIADCTDRNPNVFYELGIAHTLGKRVVLITQSSDDIPFDIRHIRYINYDFTPRGMATFEKSLEMFIRNDRA